MNFYLYLASLCLGLVAAVPEFDPSLDEEWKQWKETHRRAYALNEHDRRRSIWEKNFRMIEMHNNEYSTGKQTFQMRMNKFGDMTNEEFRQVKNGFKYNRGERGPKGSLFHEPLSVEIPESVDWRKKGYVTPVKDQGRCGSCWAFSTTGSIEGQWFRKTGKLVSLSEQNLIDCSTDEGNRGCHGGMMENAFKHVKNNGGIDTEESYPYFAKDGECHYKPENSGANVTGFVYIPYGEENTLKNAVATVGPVSVSIDASYPSFHFYHSGVYYEEDCNHVGLDHAVLAVGYGTEEESGMEYWIVKNSWGQGWGEDGYIRMARNKNNHCGIATEAIYPKV